MKHGRQLVAQLVALCGLAVQLVVTGALPFAHIEQEAALYSHETHFSAPTEGPCIPHEEPTCQVCRAGALNFLGQSPVAPIQASGCELTIAFAAADHQFTAPVFTTSARPRAPPLV